MYTPPISSNNPQYGATATLLLTPQKTMMMQDIPKGTPQAVKQSSMQACRQEEAKGGLSTPSGSGLAMKSPSEGSKAPTSTTTVPVQLARDFLNVVKKGDISEILSFISKAH